MNYLKFKQAQFKACLFIAAFSIYSVGVKAQTAVGKSDVQKDSSGGSAPATTYMMPNGTFISKDKIDSVRKAWNGALFMGYEQSDRAKGILHLVKLTDDDMKQIVEKNANDALAVKAMLNKPAPDFNLADLNGKEWSLTALRGKVVVLNFWYTSCPPCLEEMPQLNELTKMYPPDKVVFLALTFDSAPKVQLFLKTHEFSYIMLPGSKAIDQQYKISGWPTSFVISKKGIIKFGSNIDSDIKQDLFAAINANL